MLLILLFAILATANSPYAEDELERQNAEREEAMSDDTLKEQFKHYDLNGDNKLDVAEVKTAFKDTIDDAALFHLFTRIDLDESGTISEDEYVTSQRKGQPAR